MNHHTKKSFKDSKEKYKSIFNFLLCAHSSTVCFEYEVIVQDVVRVFVVEVFVKSSHDVRVHVQPWSCRETQKTMNKMLTSELEGNFKAVLGCVQTETKVSFEWW